MGFVVVAHGEVPDITHPSTYKVRSICGLFV
jgi:hypothetical protein